MINRCQHLRTCHALLQARYIISKPSQWAMYAQHEHKIMSVAHAVLVGLIPLTTYRIPNINKEDNYHDLQLWGHPARALLSTAKGNLHPWDQHTTPNVYPFPTSGRNPIPIPHWGRARMPPCAAGMGTSMTIFLSIVGVIVTATVIASFVLSWLVVRDIDK